MSVFQIQLLFYCGWPVDPLKYTLPAWNPSSHHSQLKTFSDMVWLICLEALCGHIAVRDEGTSTKKQLKWAGFQFFKLFNETIQAIQWNLSFYIHMYAIQYRSYYFTIFTTNLYTFSLELLSNKSCFLGSLLFSSLHLEFSSSPQRHCSLIPAVNLKKNS